MKDPVIYIEADWAAKVARLEARCDELNEACSAKQVLIDHTASDLRDMRDLYEREKGELRAEVELLKARLRAERIPLAASDCTCMGFIISDGRICGGCARNLRLALADCEGAYVRLSREQDTLRAQNEGVGEQLVKAIDDIAALRQEVAELQALEMNHDGACVRLKAEVERLRAALRGMVDYFETAEWRMVDAHEWRPLRDAALAALAAQPAATGEGAS